MNGSNLPGASSARPPALDDAMCVDLDVREELRRGEEPFRIIMDAVDALEPEAVLRLRAIFEPVPLYAVMARKGYRNWTEKLEEDDWRVWFYPEEAEEGAEAAEAAEGAEGVEGADGGAAVGVEAAEEAGEGETIVLDVRGLEPPEPLVRTLEALESLPDGATLKQLNVRVPQFLLPQLKSRGFEYDIERISDELTHVHIRRARSAAS